MVQSRGLPVRRTLVWGLSGGLLLCATGVIHAGNIVKKLTLDKSAPIVELFDGIEAKQFQAKMLVSSPNDAVVSIKNLTDAPLTVALPKAAVAMPVMPQLALPGNVNGGNQFNNNPNNAGANNGRPNQAVGGQFQPAGNQQFPNPGANGNQPAGLNMFSIPPEAIVQLEMRTVCLDYGVADPDVGVKYELQKLETAIADPVLRQLFEDYSPRVDQDVMQAAVWHLASGLSWQQIANLPADNSPLAGVPRFPDAVLKSAREQVEQSKLAATKRIKDPASPVREQIPPIVSRRTAKAP